MSEQLYRMYNADGVLLYVGISKSAIRRMTEHAGKPWFLDVCSVTVETMDCDRKQAEEVERRVIQDERPLHNVAHNEANVDRQPPEKSKQSHVDSTSVSATVVPTTRPPVDRDKRRHGRLGAFVSWSRTVDRTARTSNARAAGPGSVEWHLARLDPAVFAQASESDRRLAAEAAKREYFARIALRSAAARRRPARRSA